MTTRAYFLLDATGSMLEIKDKTISAFNEYLGQLKADVDGAHILFTLRTFNSIIRMHTLIDSMPVARVQPLGSAGYQPDGMTPLYDAIGQTIREAHLNAAKDDRVIVIIQTDGMENASREFTLPAVRRVVVDRQAEGWQFVFLGADIDAYGAAGAIGISTGNTVAYASATATADTFQRVGRATTAYARTGTRSEKLMDDTKEGSIP